MTTLIVDDDDAFRARLQRCLDGETRTARCIEEGLRAAEDWQPSVILLDVWFRGSSMGTGIDAIESFRKVCPRAEIVIMTGHYDEADQKRAERAKVFGYVEKGDNDVLAAMALAARQSVTSSFVATASRAHH